MKMYNPFASIIPVNNIELLTTVNGNEDFMEIRKGNLQFMMNELRDMISKDIADKKIDEQHLIYLKVEVKMQKYE